MSKFWEFGEMFINIDSIRWINITEKQIEIKYLSGDVETFENPGEDAVLALEGLLRERD